MKLRILNLGISATHESIVTIENLGVPIAISDSDAFVFDPDRTTGTDQTVFNRRRAEVRDLLLKKGGVILCLLRYPRSFGYIYGGHNADPYDLFEPADAMVGSVRNVLRAGQGSTVNVIPKAKGASAAYFRILAGVLRFDAYANTTPGNFEQLLQGTVFAVDSIQHPIGFEIPIGAGRICLVPIPNGATGERVGSAIVRSVETHYGGPTEIAAPLWLTEVEVPGANSFDPTIEELEQKKSAIEIEIRQFQTKRSDLLNYRALLYGYGKSVLEPVVRSAFRLFGFGVPEPAEYKGEWDVELHELITLQMASRTAIGEVEGSEGVIDVDKYRQLLDYVQTEALDGRDPKGILIGNGFRLTSPDASERNSQFSAHALNGARKNGFCLVPSTELFKAVCTVLDAPEDEALKIDIRNSILSTVGVWAFAREASALQQSASATAEPENSAKGDAANTSS